MTPHKTKTPPKPTRRNKLPAGQRPIDELLSVMARLRAPDGCPWDREQDHMTLRWHAVEEVYELIDAIEAGDDHELEEELGDLLLQVVFHCQLGKERGAFDFERVAHNIATKLVRRHPHVFGDLKVKDVDQVWANWEKIKRAEKHGTHHARPSALDGIPRHLPMLMRAEKLLKKAKRAKLLDAPASTAPRATGKPNARKPASQASGGGTDARASEAPGSGIASQAPGSGTHAPASARPLTRDSLGRELFELAAAAHARGWSAEDLLRSELRKRERAWRKLESKLATAPQPD